MNTKMRAIGRAAMLLLAVVLVAASCGNDSDTAAPTTTSAGDDAPTTTEHDHQHSPVAEVTYEPVPSLALEVLKDPMSGWNLHATVSDFRLAPEHVSTAPIDGEGHMHLYIDGEKITRLYGEWYALGELEPGEREIRVELSANDHATLGVDGVPIDATVMVDVPAASDDDAMSDDAMSDDEMSDDAMSDDAMSDDAMSDMADGVHEISIEVSEGSVVGGSQRHEVATGDTVQLTVFADVADEVHVHGYDLFADVAPDAPAMVEFEAEFEGSYEVELEGSGLLLMDLVVG